MVKKAKPPPTKYEILDRLLLNFGKDTIDRARFWREMKAHDYDQDDIDWWCAENAKRSA